MIRSWDLETGTVREVGSAGKGIGAKMGDIAFWEPPGEAAAVGR